MNPSPSLLPGVANHTYPARFDGTPAMIRSNHPDSAQLGVDRERERRVLEAIRSRPWAPEVIHWSPERLVTRFVPGPHPASGQHTPLYTLAHYLRQVHDTPVPEDIPTLDMRDTLRHLMARAAPLPDTLRQQVADLIRTWRPTGRRVLCHHDWHPGNIVVHRGHWVILDWEYAAVGDPLTDIASAALGFRLGEPGRRRLARLMGIANADLEAACTLMQAVNDLWSRVIRTLPVVTSRADA